MNFKFQHRFENPAGPPDWGEVEFEIVGVETWGPNDLNNGGICIKWTASVGFGECLLIHDKDGGCTVDSETYGNEFVAKALACVAMNARFRD